MSKNNVISPEQEALGEAVSKTEKFFDENGKKVVYAIIALVVLALAIFGYKALVVEPNMAKASDMLLEAQERFDSQTPDYELALNGDAEGAGFIEVADSYGSTPSGNLASHYAGICYLHLGDFDNAAAYLKKYKAVKGIPGSLINAQNLGLQGDIAVEADNFAGAVALYKKAVAASDNSTTAPSYLQKAALASIAAGQKAEAISIFESITAKYPASVEARNADKFKASLK